MVDYSTLIQKAFSDAAKNMQALAENNDLQMKLAEVAQVIVNKYRAGGCVFACGNGGSAADSQHLVAELISKLAKDRTPIRAFAMTVDTSILTAIGNDYGYELVFDRQVRGLMRKDDVLIAITTSGNSPNVLRALQACREIGATSVLLTGKGGGPAKELADFAIIAPGAHTAQIQEAHIAIYHTLCYLIEVGLIEAGVCRYV